MRRGRCLRGGEDARGDGVVGHSLLSIEAVELRVSRHALRVELHLLRRGRQHPSDPAVPRVLRRILRQTEGQAVRELLGLEVGLRLLHSFEQGISGFGHHLAPSTVRATFAPFTKLPFWSMRFFRL